MLPNRRSELLNLLERFPPRPREFFVNLQSPMLDVAVVDHLQ